jgi:predicted dehydrogenase
VSGTVSIAVADKPVLAWEYRDGDAIGPSSPTVGTEKATADDVAVVTGRLDNDAAFVLTGTWAVHHGSGNQLEIHGSEGSAVVAGNSLRAARRGDDLADVEVPAEYALDLAAGERMVPASARLFQDVAAVVDGRRSPEEAVFARLEDGLKTQQVMDTVRRDGERVIGR